MAIASFWTLAARCSSHQKQKLKKYGNLNLVMVEFGAGIFHPGEKNPLGTFDETEKAIKAPLLAG